MSLRLGKCWCWKATWLVLLGGLAPPVLSAAPAILVIDPVRQLEGPAGDPMSQPTDVVVGSSGDVWVLDGVNKRLARFSPKGAFERYVSLAGAGTRSPAGLTSPSATAAPDRPATATILREVPSLAERRGAGRQERGDFIPVWTPPRGRGVPAAVAPATGQLAPPERLAVGLGMDGQGRLLVGNRERGTIDVLDPEGNRVSEIRIPRELSEHPADPTDVLPSPSGRSLIIVDNDNHCVKEVDLNGRLIRRVGRRGAGLGEMHYPATIAFVAGQRMAVVDVLNARVDMFDREGRPLPWIGKQGVVAGTFFRPKGIAVDAAGRLHVTDSFTGLVQSFDADGKAVAVWGTASGQPHRLRTPASICTDASGHFYVVEMLANRVSVWRKRGRP